MSPRTCGSFVNSRRSRLTRRRECKSHGLFTMQSEDNWGVMRTSSRTFNGDVHRGEPGRKRPGAEPRRRGGGYAAARERQGPSTPAWAGRRHAAGQFVGMSFSRKDRRATHWFTSTAGGWDTAKFGAFFNVIDRGMKGTKCSGAPQHGQRVAAPKRRRQVTPQEKGVAEQPVAEGQKFGTCSVAAWRAARTADRSHA